MVNPDKIILWESTKGSNNFVGVNFVDIIYPTEGSSLMFVFKSKNINDLPKFKIRQLTRKLQYKIWRFGDKDFRLDFRIHVARRLKHDCKHVDFINIKNKLNILLRIYKTIFWHLRTSNTLNRIIWKLSNT